MPNQSGTAEEPSLQAEAVSCRLRKELRQFAAYFFRERQFSVQRTAGRAVAWRESFRGG